jgi:predicted NBD/HSP70 family sugar kinase
MTSPPNGREVGRDEPVRQRSLREHNLALVLRHVATGPRPVSRGDLATVTGLTRATVSGLVDELIAGSLVSEVDPLPRTGAGRPATGLALSSSGPAGLGLEINVDYLAACVLDLTGTTRLLRIRHRDQRGRTPGRVLADLARLATTAITAARADGLRVCGITVGVPGLVTGDGVVRRAPNLGWQDVDVAAPLRGVAEASAVTVENEANLAALAELHAHPDPRPSFVYISGEIGVGAGLVLEGRLLRGPRGYGGELGHVTIRPDGERCRCGSRGCLETFASQEVLMRAAGIPDSAADPLARLKKLAEAGDRAALSALNDAGIALGIAASDVVNLVDVDTVVLGGIFAPLTPWLVGPVSAEIGVRTVTSSWAPVTVRAAELGTNATVIGAAGAVVRAVRDAPAAWLGQLSPVPA